MIAKLLAASLLIGMAAPAYAQGASEDKARLKKLLEEKFGKNPRAKERQTAPTKPDEIYVIKPDGKVERAPSGAVKPRSSLAGERWATLNAPRTLRSLEVQEPAEPRESSRAWPVTRRTPSLGADGLRLAQMRLAQKSESATSGSPGEVLVRPNVIIVQLKPSVSLQQIDALIAKYNLRVVRHVASLGVLHVELPGAASGIRSGSSLQATLEPKLVVDLRAEPAVEAAFVDVSMSPRSRPRAGNASAPAGQRQLRWEWGSAQADDGNWGLKALRMPSVWSILLAARKAESGQPRPVLAFLDNGFATHPQLKYRNAKGDLWPLTAHANCQSSHGTHVAGIAAASFGSGAGMDGIVPDAVLDAVQISQELVIESLTEGTVQAQQQVAFFMDAITDLAEYLDEHEVQPNERRVVNVSLAYNWAGASTGGSADPTSDRIIRDQIRQHARVVQYLVNRVHDQVLFVVAAGNDSDGLERPLRAELATPFAYAALNKSTTFTPSLNIMVVEAHDRGGRRASFSNVGGHVAAPGIDILSAFASQSTPYGVCAGTSQAAPHVSALAAILFELDPRKTPSEVIDIISKAARPAPQGGSAPLVDALEAVLRLNSDHLRRLADLNGDERVDSSDLAIFRADLVALEDGRFGMPISRDLNEDGAVDDNERCWPRIDLNGSGRASYAPADKRIVGGIQRSDLDVLEAAWTDKAEPFSKALKESRLEDLIAIWRGTAQVAAAPRLELSLPCK